jgi:hypothetical protein
MEITVKRSLYTEKSTIGNMLINGKQFCYTLEDTCRDANRDGDLDDEGETKVFGKTAIPSGKYPVILSYSNRFKRILPEVLNVPGYAGIRIHNGNTSADTEGCLLIGSQKSRDFVGNSRVTLEAFMEILNKVKAPEKIQLHLQDAPL